MSHGAIDRQPPRRLVPEPDHQEPRAPARPFVPPSGLMGALWGYSHVGDRRTVDVHIARLRAVLGPAQRERIQTVRRVGYRFQPFPQDHLVKD